VVRPRQMVPICRQGLATALLHYEKIFETEREASSKSINPADQA